jgi:hypothetical protein
MPLKTIASRKEEPSDRTRSIVAPRALNLQQAAHYLGVSYWTFRDYVLAGHIPVIDLPPLRPREGARARQSLRRVLVDVRDLDRFIESRKA